MLKLESYKTVSLSDRIELPDIAELIRFPFCHQVDIDELYKYGPSDMKNILDMMPIRNNTKYISVNTSTQLLSPKTTSAPRANWHLDGESFKEDSQTTIHLLVSDCEAVTEFTQNEIYLDMFNEDSTIPSVEIEMSKSLHIIEPISAESSKIITFDGCKHLHRAIRPTKHEFRFMIRVMESNSVDGIKFKNSLLYQSDVYDDGVLDYSNIDLSYISDNKTVSHRSIEKDNNKITLYFN